MSASDQLSRLVSLPWVCGYGSCERFVTPSQVVDRSAVDDYSPVLVSFVQLKKVPVAQSPRCTKSPDYCFDWFWVIAQSLDQVIGRPFVERLIARFVDRLHPIHFTERRIDRVHG